MISIRNAQQSAAEHAALAEKERVSAEAARTQSTQEAERAKQAERVANDRLEEIKAQTAARQQAANSGDVQRHRECLQRASPAVPKADERVPILGNTFPGDRSDDCVETRAVSAPGEHADAHNSYLSIDAEVDCVR